MVFGTSQLLQALLLAPDPVGVGQTVQVIMIIELLPPSVGIEAVTGTYGGWIG